MTTDTPPKPSKGPRKPRVNFDMLKMSGVMMPDGRSAAAKKIATYSKVGGK